jgi:Flp pilus assembly protein TadG
MLKSHPFPVLRPHRPAAKRPRTRACHRGQNLVELVLTLPFVILMMFFIIEIGRAWMTYESAKMAARDGAYTASIYHNATTGQTQLNNKLSAAGLSAKVAQVQQIQNEHAYKADVIVTFTPFFGGLSIPTLSGTMPIIPSAFDLSYSSITDVSIY